MPKSFFFQRTFKVSVKVSDSLTFVKVIYLYSYKTQSLTSLFHHTKLFYDRSSKTATKHTLQYQVLSPLAFLNRSASKYK